MRSREAEGCEHPLPLVSPKSMVGAGAAAGATAVRGGTQKEAAQSAHKRPKNQVGRKSFHRSTLDDTKYFGGKRFFSSRSVTTRSALVAVAEANKGCSV